MPRIHENYKCSKCGKILHEGDSVLVCIECRRPVCEECWKKGQQLCPICKESILKSIINN
jgi:hypothetical protein